jgi:hypothetical protein
MMDSAEKLLWRRIKNLKKMVKKATAMGDVPYAAMWKNKLYEIAKTIDPPKTSNGVGR